VSAGLGDQNAMQAAFGRAVELAPDDLKIRQQYTSVLSQTQQYDAALQQAQSALQLAQSQQRKDEVDRLTKMVENLERQRAGGS
jgi:tetratricopeptide (TPR) repeat protein